MKCLKIWFNNDKSRNFIDVTSMTRKGNMMVICANNAKEFMINWNNVNIVEEYEE